jgi:hypothetical protein
MAINNFTTGTVDEQGNLELEGVTTEVPGRLTFNPLDPKTKLPGGSEIHVIVISVDGEPRRCEADSSNPTSSTWDAQVPAGENPFASGECVYAIGRAKVPGEPDFVWANVLRVG